MKPYRVVGRTVRGHSRGEIVWLSLSPRLERHYVVRGDLELVDEPIAPDEDDNDQPSDVDLDPDDDADEPAVDDDEPSDKE